MASFTVTHCVHGTRSKSCADLTHRWLYSHVACAQAVLHAILPSTCASLALTRYKQTFLYDYRPSGDLQAKICCCSVWQAMGGSGSPR